MLDAMIADLERSSAEQARALPDVGRIMWLAADRLLPGQRDRLHGLLADDWLFARFLVGCTEPSFGDRSRPMQWTALKDALGIEWLISRVRQLPDEVGTEPEINEVVQTAKQHAERQAATAPANDDDP